MFNGDVRFVPFILPGGKRLNCVQYTDDVKCVVTNLHSFKVLSENLMVFQKANGRSWIRLRLGGWRLKTLYSSASRSDHKSMVYDSAVAHLVMSRGKRRQNCLSSGLKAFPSAGCHFLGRSLVIDSFVTPVLWYPGTVFAIPRNVLPRLERVLLISFGLVKQWKGWLYIRILANGGWV